jgi:hypothetical protein
LVSFLKSRMSHIHPDIPLHNIYQWEVIENIYSDCDKSHLCTTINYIINQLIYLSSKIATVYVEKTVHFGRRTSGNPSGI